MLQQPRKSRDQESLREREPKTHFGRDAAALSALLFLTRDPHVEDEIKGQARALKAQATVAAFVGAIQTQAMSTSFQENQTKLIIATNALFLVGIFLNVIGAYYALVSSSALEANLYELKSTLDYLTDKQVAEASQLPLSPLARRIITQRHSNRPAASDIPSAVAHEPSALRDHSPFAETALERLSRSIQGNRNAGLLGGVTIALGIISCPAALLCLVQATQPVAVKVTVYTVVGILVFLRALLALAIPIQNRFPLQRT